jgi:23S rRNA pseudouridine1911/1915/1917 synthase
VRQPRFTDADRDRRREEQRAGIVRPAEIPAEAVMRVLRVPPELAGQRLDRFVQHELRGTSRSRSQVIIARGAYDAAGARLRKNHRLRAEERVVLWRAPWDEEPAPEELPIVHEDDSLLGVNKPPGVVVHPTARHHRFTVAVMLAARRPDEHLTLLHRIDRETSGVLLLARTRAADRIVKAQLEQRRGVVKRYLAIVWGTPEWESTHCELPMEPDAESRFRVKMRVAAPGTGLTAATTFEVLGRRRARGRRYTLLRCSLHTGRQHQIRVHLAALGFPVVGDKLYGPDESILGRAADRNLTEEDRSVLELDRHALHASDITIAHPVTGASITVVAPLWPDMAGFWDTLEEAP